MRKHMPFLIIPTAAILAVGISGCSIIQSLTGGTHSTNLEVGQCLKDLGENTAEVSDVPVVDCSEPHLYEVYYEAELSGDSLPDPVTLQDESNTACTGSGFSDYVGVPVEDSEYEITYLAPSQATWDQGDRKISCLITSSDSSEMTDSAKGSAK